MGPEGRRAGTPGAARRPAPRLRALASSARRRAWHAWYGLRWRLGGARAARRSRLRHVRGFALVVLPGVFDPVTFLSGELLVDALVSLVRPGERVLDLGTGSGLGALASARMGAREVVAVDIDPLAGRCAAGNVVLAGLGDRVAVRVGDLFGPVGAERFDLVAFNPPWLAAAPPPYGRALRLEPTLPIRFAGELASHLELRGRSLLVLPDDHRAAAWLGPLRAAGFSLERWCVRDRGSERLAAWVATPASGS